ncbi:MAG TPA: penicillin-binding protein [Desulfovibrio sp.]|nr:penicillin-binding protein [Desulfovibrio sp.]
MKKTLLTLCILVVAGVAIGASLAVMMVMWASRDLPSFTRIADYRPPQVTVVQARDGSVMAQFFREKRFLVALGDMPARLPMAFLAAEDDSFYRHDGIDPVAIGRAFIKNLQAGSIKQGGSTITQQIVKRLLLSSERSYERKIKEAILAYRLERYLTKDEILTIYLNQIYLGGGAYGVESAARTYFGKHVNELSIAECAVLGGLPQAPSKYNPFRDPEATKQRQLYVLRRMFELGWISREEHEAAVHEPLVYKSMDESIGRAGAWYVEEVRRQLIDFFSEDNVHRLGLKIDRYGEDAVYEAGLQVTTAMMPEHQIAAERALREGLESATRRHGWRGPLQKLKPTEYAGFLQQENFTPDALAGGGWARALVTKVVAQGAEVRLGQYRGFIDVKTMTWCRTPNIRVAPEGAAPVKDARKVLEEGDVVWVSGLGPAGNATSYNPALVSRGGVVQLALEQYPDVQGAIVSIEPQTGDVVALVGGYSFTDSQFNRATQARRQPGSSFKPIVYSAALDNGFTAGSVVLDAPVVYINEYTDKVWRPENFEGNFAGPMLLRTALAKSRNLCTIRVAQQIGIPAIIERAKALGLEPQFPNELSVSLGAVAVSPLNMAQAYTAFANEGRVSTPRMIVEIKDAWGETLYRRDPELREAISPQNAFVMASLLKEVVQDGTATRAKALGRPVAGKTGTTNDEKDAWFMGFSPYLVTGVYIGYDQVAPMGRFETGGRAALPVFVTYRQGVDHLYQPDDFTMPPGIVYARVDGRTGMLAGPSSSSSYMLPFILGTQPSATSGEAMERGEDDVRSGEDLLKQLY